MLLEGKKDLTIFAVTERGAGLAARLKPLFADVLLLGPDELRDGRIKRRARAALASSRAILFISAAGIAVRAVAPYLKGKHLDPAVVVMDERARFVIPILSGHLGGGNDLARLVSGVFGSTPVITTATDLAGLPCVEDIAKKFSLAVENPGIIKKVNSAILNGKTVWVIDTVAKRRAAIKREFGPHPFKFRAGFPEKYGGDDSFVFVSSEAGIKESLRLKTLVLRPREISVGVGCRRGASADEIRKALESAFKKAGLSLLSIKGLASVDIKKDEAGLKRLSKEMGLELRFLSPTELKKVKYPSRPSAKAVEVAGGGVSEPAALITGGTRTLCIKKTISGRVTIAAARVPFSS